MAQKLKKTQAKKAASKSVAKKKTVVKKAAVAKKTIVKSKSAKPKKVTAKKNVAKKTIKAAPKKVVTKKAVKKTPKTLVKKATSKKKTTAKKTVRKITPKKKFKPQAKTQGQTFGVNTSTNEAMEKMMTQSTTQFDKFAQEATGFSRENTEAFMKSGTIFAKGFEDFMRTSMTLAQSSAEKQAQYMKEAMEVKSLDEFKDVQNKIAKASMEDFMSNATKISEMGKKLLTEASEPINMQADKVKKAAA